MNWGALVPPSFGLILKFKPKLERPVAEGRENSTRLDYEINPKQAGGDLEKKLFHHLRHGQQPKCLTLARQTCKLEL